MNHKYTTISYVLLKRTRVYCVVCTDRKYDVISYRCLKRTCVDYKYISLPIVLPLI